MSFVVLKATSAKGLSDLEEAVESEDFEVLKATSAKGLSDSSGFTPSEPGIGF